MRISGILGKVGGCCTVVLRISPGPEGRRTSDPPVTANPANLPTEKQREHGVCSALFIRGKFVIM